MKKIDQMIYTVEHMVRPVLTLAVVVMFVGGAIILALLKLITGIEYLTTMGPVATLVFGYWFGERSQRRQIQYADGVGYETDQTPPTPSELSQK